MSLSIKLPKGPSSFSARADKATKRKVARAMDMKLRAGFRVLLDSTPVWSGNTIANYRVSLGSRTREFEEYTDKDSVDVLSPEFGGVDRDAAAAASEASLEAAIARLYKNPFQTIYIVNNVRYDTGQGIEALEYGSIGRQAYGMFGFAKAVMENIDVSGI